MKLLQALHQRWRRAMFLERQPEQGEVYLNQRRVFTLPNRTGLAFLVLLLVLFLTSINYSINLGLALTFVLSSCMVVNIVLSFRNLAFLHLSPGAAAPVFAGEEAQFRLTIINRRKHMRYALHIGFVKGGMPEQAFDLAGHSQIQLELACPTTRRGYLRIPRVHLHTHFPLGLLRAWSTWLPDIRALVYPAPELDAPPLPFHGGSQSEDGGSGGQEDFSGVRAYQSGDMMKQLAWRQMAKIDLAQGGPLLSKQFEGGSSQHLELDFSQLPATLDLEWKLSRLTHWILEAEARGLPYGFRLGAIHYAPAIGYPHREQCLQALALYE
jgi:uncharacterized protein (DUF58 family)